tara:strand:+ start:259 stop:459 length:201 start_codon:yes stop_codon:yes gene_type:complete
MFHYIIPNDPAVIPTHTKNPNSKRSLEPGGIEFKSTASGIIALQMIVHQYMLLLQQQLRKEFDTSV